ncbi:hypothetical protein Mycsm_01786 [Mycobacterium sp. JS623]|uniref:hypothetical protein n=1 Tax=Mycobacterium sp. JS623 TaxID=212767 RepID=UPI0002A5625A|nr:hypothetical protein [Mycobacterium sp. JS623]AGB22174.1 hypothetical protein Mycsm_01786 [Mycobacterium sp. JS623]
MRQIDWAGTKAGNPGQATSIVNIGLSSADSTDPVGEVTSLSIDLDSLKYDTYQGNPAEGVYNTIKLADFSNSQVTKTPDGFELTVDARWENEHAVALDNIWHKVAIKVACQ